MKELRTYAVTLQLSYLYILTDERQLFLLQVVYAGALTEPFRRSLTHAWVAAAAALGVQVRVKSSA
jgi:hypothetical protein